ncbi:hypothetical protein ACRDU6_00265 (plasmid) [Mycolicibacterium sp. ELW1]
MALIIVAGAVLLMVFLGPPLRRWIIRLPEIIASPVLAVATGAIVNVWTNVTNSFNDGVPIARAIQDQLLLGVPAVSLFSLALFNTIVRARQKKSTEQGLKEAHDQAVQQLQGEHQRELQEVRRVNRQEWQQFIGEDFENLLFAVGTTLSQSDPSKRDRWIERTQTIAVWAASQFVGRLQTRVRACLYRHDETQKTLSPMHGLYSGGRPCRRHFDEHHPTYRSIVNDGEPVVRLEIPEEEVERDNLSYRGFISHPIRVQGQDRVFGALMVDSANPGDLDDMVDLGKVAVLAALLSATFFARNNPGAL